MKPRHQVSRAAIELIKRFEGYRSKAAQAPDGRWTIGYGHTLTAREGAAVSTEDAEALLIYDLIAVAHGINEWTFTPLSQNQFDALCAFAFNIGLDSFRRSAVLRRLNEGALIQAACAMELWRKADFEGERIVIDALVRRRAAEKSLFLTPTAGFIPVPTPVLRPNLDLDGLGGVPRETPTAVTAWMDGPVAGAGRDAVTAFAEPAPPSAMQMAAESVSARLATIFPDEEESAPAVVPEIAPEPAPEPEPEIEVPAPEPEIAPEVEPTPEPEPEAAPKPVEAPVADEVQDEIQAELEPLVAPAVAEEPPAVSFAALAAAAKDANVQHAAQSAYDFPSILSDTPEAGDFEADDRAKPLRAYLPLLALGLLGGAILAGGVFWALIAQGGAGPGFWVGWMAGLAGVLILGRAVYLFLERLGQVGGGLDDDLNGK